MRGREVVHVEWLATCGSATVMWLSVPGRVAGLDRSAAPSPRSAALPTLRPVSLESGGVGLESGAVAPLSGAVAVPSGAVVLEAVEQPASAATRITAELIAERMP